MALTDTEKTNIRFYLGYAVRTNDPLNVSKVFAHALNPLLEDNMNKLTSDEENIVRSWLGDIEDMADEIKSARSTLNIEAAGTFKKNKAEIRDRIQLFNYTRRQLASFLQVTIVDSRNAGQGSWLN